MTKAAFAYLMMQLVDDGVINLDAPVTALLKKPLDCSKLSTVRPEPVEGLDELS